MNRALFKAHLCIWSIAAALFVNLPFAISQTPILHENAKITAANPAQGDAFGVSLAVSGDLMVVGSMSDDDACPADPNCDSGSVYVYEVSTGQLLWYLTADDTDRDDEFGASVDIENDIIIIGARNVGSSIPGKIDGSGAAYLFDASTGQQLFKLTASDGSAWDWFGGSVAIHGNIAVIGAFNHDNTSPDLIDGHGAAYLFDITTGQQLAKLTASDTAPGDYFGNAVSINGDIIVIGAVGKHRGTGQDAGAVYIFRQIGKMWVEETILTVPNAEAFDFFGMSIALSGNTILVGAPGENTPAGIDAGSIYVYRKIGSSWLPEAVLVASDTQASSFLGTSVAISGPPGNPVAVISAQYDDNSDGLASGKAYVFRRIGSNWYEEMTLESSDALAGDSFGSDVVVSVGVAYIGAEFSDIPNGVFNSGSVYLFNLAPCPVDIHPPGGNGIINIEDLVVILNSFGPCSGCPSDITPPGGNGTVNIDDLVAILNAFGPCP